MTAPDLRERLERFRTSQTFPFYEDSLLREAVEAVAERDRLQAALDRLTGMKFSDRMHSALVFRAENAEAERDALIADIAEYQANLTAESAARVAAEAERDSWKQQVMDEIGANLAFREAGGALPDEDMPTFCARLVAERDALRAALHKQESRYGEV